MLEIIARQNTWLPPIIDDKYIDRILKEIRVVTYDSYDWIQFVCTEPYIDFLCISVRDADMDNCVMHRFTFHENYCWNSDDEEEFEQIFLRSSYPVLYEPFCLDRIFGYYSKEYPGWHLNRYFTHPERLLDHIHHCFKRNTIKELLYKSGLDDLAFRAPKPHEVNLLATSPAEIYEVPYRVVKAVNCEYGAILLSEQRNRELLQVLNHRYPDIFKTALNDAQCSYLARLLNGDLEWPEINRLFTASRKRLSNMWSRNQYMMFVNGEETRVKQDERDKALARLDPVYEKYIDRIGIIEKQKIEFYLLDKRAEFDRDIRISNRKRDATWQERDGVYAVRYPQTINDFCREAIYMSNCLLTYLEAFVENETTILFMRKEESINTLLLH